MNISWSQQHLHNSLSSADMGRLTVIFNLLHIVGASMRQKEVSYLRNLPGSLDTLYTPSQEVLQHRREFALPRIHNTTWNIWCWLLPLENTMQNGYVWDVSFSVLHLTWFKRNFLEYRPTLSNSFLVINVKKQLGYLTKLSVYFWTAYTVRWSPVIFLLFFF